MSYNYRINYSKSIYSFKKKIVPHIFYTFYTYKKINYISNYVSSKIIKILLYKSFFVSTTI